MNDSTLDELIENSVSLTGKWWFGGDKRRQFVGTITFAKQTILKLSGGGQIDLTKHKYEEVCGRGSSGEHIILRDCFVNSTSTTLTKGGWALGLVPTDIIVFLGSTPVKWVTTTVNHLEVAIPYLDFWLDRQLFKTDIVGHAVKYEHTQEESVDLEGVKVVFSTWLSGVESWNINTRNQMEIKQSSVLRLEYPNEVEYSQSLNLYRRLEAFFRVAYASNFYLRKFDGSSLRNARRFGAMRQVSDSKEIYLNRFVDKVVERSPTIIDHLFLFKAKHLDDLEGTLRRWLEVEEPMQPVYQLLLTSLEDGVYIEQRFISLVNAIEIFHHRFNGRKRKPEDEWLAQRASILGKLTGKDKKLVKGRLRDANDLTLEERITDLVYAANGCGFRGLMPDVISKIADTRNSYVHEDFGGNAYDLNLAMANEALTEVLLINLLLELNFTSEVIHTLTKNTEIFRYSSGLMIYDT